MGWRRWFGRSKQDEARAREIAVHIAEATDYYVRQGIDREEAARLARLRFGNRRAYREKVNDMNTLPVLDALRRDLSFAVRRLRKAPGFSAAVILTLALVVGATSAIFSLADGILLRPLPLPQPDRLAVIGMFRVSAKNGSYTTASVDGAMYRALRERATTVDVAAAGSGVQGVNFVSGNVPSYVQNKQVGDGYFRVLGMPPAIGREFTTAEAQPGGDAVVVLSHTFWQRLFHGEPSALGQTILLRGEPFTVIGVASEALSEFDDADVWTPLKGVGGGLNYQAVARLKDGATVESADAELATFGEAPFTAQSPMDDGDSRRLVLQDMKTVLFDGTRQPIVMLGWAVATVLLIACVNIAALLMARSGSRSKEIATRMALGSGRLAVVRQLMIESAVMAALGGVLGILVGMVGLEGLKAVGGGTFSAWTQAALSGRTVAVTLGLSALTCVLFGLLPAWQTSRIDVQRALVDGGSRSIAGGSRHVARRLLVVAEVALGVVMLVAAGLLLRQFASLRSLDPGFSPNRLYTVSVSLQDARYESPASVNQLFDRSLDQLSRTPGIEAATISQRLPYERLLNIPFSIDGVELDMKRVPLANIAYVTPTYLTTFGIPLRDGRDLDARDTASTPLVMIVNETFARIYFKDASPVGQRVKIGMRGPSVEIVGVTGDVQQFGTGFYVTGMHRGPILTSPTIYLPAAQTSAGFFQAFSPTWTVRAGSAGAAAEALTRAISAVDPMLPLGEVRSMSDVVDRSTAQPRLMMTLVGALATAALLLSAIGIHGLVTHVISERTREFGIRLALGASASGMIRDVAKAGVVLAAVGAVVGFALSFPATQLVGAFLTELTTRDVRTYVGVAVLLFLVASVSSVWPAMRLLRLDPAKTLRD